MYKVSASCGAHMYVSTEAALTSSDQ